MFLGIRNFLLFLLIGLVTVIAISLFRFPVSISPEISPTISPTPKPTLPVPPQSKILENNYHVFQTFNNCGPAALSMVLSYFGISKTQQELGLALRPYQNPEGDNDDKSVTLDELAEKAKEYGLIPYHRPLGSIEFIKLFIAHDIPIIARTLTKENEDIGHYRVIKGYSELEKQIIQDDSLQGKNLKFTYDEFNSLWKRFSFEYLVLVPTDKQEIADGILGQDKAVLAAWEKAVKNAREELSNNPNDIYSRFNLSVALYNTKQYKEAVAEFEKIEDQLPFRTLWYQIEPILAYFELGNYQKVFSLTDKILNNQNRAFSELYLIRSEIYKKQGSPELSDLELEKANLYNINLKH